MAAGMLFVGLSYCISRSSIIVALGGGVPRLPWGCAGWDLRGGVRPWHCRVRRQWGCFLVPGACLCILDAGSRTEFLHIDEM